MSEPKPESRLARGQLPPVDRATIHAYEDATPGPVYYQRSAHPVGLDAERLLGELDGGQALLFPSGSGATIALLLALLGPGATVAVADGGYWGTVALLENELARWGLEIEEFDQTGEPPNADLVWLEPCANPMMSFPDLDTAIAQAHAAGAVVVVDNTVLSPVLLRPLEYGADFVLHSATQDPGRPPRRAARRRRPAPAPRITRVCTRFATASGIVAAPDPVWLLLRGMKTLSLRVERQSATALELARRLVCPSRVLARPLPGARPIRSPPSTSTRSGRCCRSTSPTQHAAAQVERSLQLIENATSLGGVASTLEARARWEPARVPPGLLRLSVGLEDVEDLWADLSRALDASRKHGRVFRTP